MPNPEIQLDPQRLVALASIARKARATLSGLNDALHDMRDRRHDLAQQRDLVLAAGAESGHIARAEAAARAADMDRQAADISADVVVREVERQEASEAVAAASANLRAAIAHAEAANLTIPAGVKEVLP